MPGVGCPGERQDSDGASKREHDLRRRGAGIQSNPGDQRMTYHFHVRREQRKALIDDRVLPAEGAHIAVPAQTRVATVLYECRDLKVNGGHLLEMKKRNIAHAEQTGSSRSRSLTMACHTS